MNNAILTWVFWVILTKVRPIQMFSQELKKFGTEVKYGTAMAAATFILLLVSLYLSPIHTTLRRLIVYTLKYG